MTKPIEGMVTMALEITELHPIFAGEVSGVDLTKPLDAEEAATIEAGMDRWGVLVFRGQAISDEQQIAFTRNFGELENYNTSGTVRKREDNRLSNRAAIRPSDAARSTWHCESIALSA